MPYVDAQQLPIPWQGRSPRSRRSSHLGAVKAAERAPSQANRMLAQYALCPLTDLEMRQRIGLPESRISARRSALMSRGWVCWVEDIIGPYSVPNGRYGLTEQGRARSAE